MTIKRALISVSDKTGIEEVAKKLSDLGVKIISTGGTSKVLKDAGVPVVDVSEVTGFPEIMIFSGLAFKNPAAASYPINIFFALPAIRRVTNPGYAFDS